MLKSVPESSKLSNEIAYKLRKTYLKNNDVDRFISDRFFNNFIHKLISSNKQIYINYSNKNITDASQLNRLGNIYVH